jgi:rfaE bifunctional protein kinase chain/domain
VVSHNQQMLRLDFEDTHDLSKEEESNFKDFIDKIINAEKPDVILLQDYNKGILTATLIEWLIQKANNLNIPVAVDPKRKNFLAYKNVTLFKPNLKEVKEALSIDLLPEESELRSASLKIQQQLNNDVTLITLSEHGVYIDDRNSMKIYPTHPRNVSDVCGAGDTVISIVSLGLAAGLNAKELAILANYSGGQVCEKPGVVPVDKAQLLEELANFDKLL